MSNDAHILPLADAGFGTGGGVRGALSGMMTTTMTTRMRGGTG